MSLHKSLVSKNLLARQRNVLKREERLEKLTKEGRMTDEDSVFGLPKVAAFKVKKKPPKEKKKPEGEEGATAAAAQAAPPAKDDKKKKK